MIHVVLVEPEIPQNTGNIARSCAATGAVLHLVRPLGFSTDDKYLKRCGLDYWHLLDIRYHDSFAELQAQVPPEAFFYATTKAKQVYADITYPEEVYLVFGKETKGLPEDLLRENLSQTIRIPIIEDARSLNLSNSVAIVLFEALRQRDFTHMQLLGKLAKE